MTREERIREVALTIVRITQQQKVVIALEEAKNIVDFIEGDLVDFVEDQKNKMVEFVEREKEKTVDFIEYQKDEIVKFIEQEKAIEAKKKMEETKWIENKK